MQNSPNTTRKIDLEQSAADFVEAMAKAVHGPHPSSRQIADITKIVVANTSLGKYL